MRSTLTAVTISVAFLGLTCLSFGQFKPAKYYKLGGKQFLSLQVTTADFNNDGILDLAVADALSDRVSVLLGKPGGSFGPPIVFPVYYPISISSGDMNHDGNQDLIVTVSGGTGNGYIGIFLGDGTGHFTPFGSYEAGIATGESAVADFNGDGHLDVAVSNHGWNNAGESMMVFFGDGTGALGKPTSYPFKVKAPGGPQGIAAGDLNGDGHIDLALGVTTFSKKNPSYVAIFVNDGNGKFELSDKYFAGGGEPANLGIADFNNDGKLDIAVAADDALGILLNRGGGKFAKVATYLPCSGCGNLDTLTVADFNLDGNLDIAVTGSLKNSVFYGKGKGKFKPAVSIADFTGVWLTSGDFNHDGAPDLAISTGGNNVAVLLNKK